MKGLFVLYSLTSEEKNFLKSKQITAERTTEEWISFFKKLRDFDRLGDSTRKWGFGLGCGGLIVAIISLFLLTVFVGFVTLPLAILAALAGWIIYFYIKPFDIRGESLSHNVIPILMILREEMNPDEKLKMRLDLRGFLLKEKMTNESKPYERGAYYQIIDRFYRDQWFDGEAMLADGTKLIWSIFDFAKYSTKSKRNFRGKHKTKYKEKHRTFITMQVGMNNKNYSLPEKIKQKGEEGAIRTKDSGDYSWMSVRKSIKHPVGKSFQPAEFVNTVAAAYVRAIPTKGGQK